MDNTTLHTFLFQCPAALRSVVLFGSWDNFCKPYHLELDSRRGRNFWKGCFTFSEIFCDGDLDMLSPKRDGPLKMGGRYWYYYEVDGEKECHNLSEPSTTVCPLLPGQHLNVLEIPIEGRSHNGSGSSDAFTRNPSDRYLTPVPPAGLKPQPPCTRDASINPYSLPTPSPRAPRSAIYLSADRLLANSPVRHARSASGSPLLSSAPLFAEFKGLKEKLASRRSQSRSRSSPNVRDLVIGAPTLVSTTVDCVDSTMLPSYRPSPACSPATSPRRIHQPQPSMPTTTRTFAPLTSYPVGAPQSGFPIIAELPAELPAQLLAELPGDEPRLPKRRRSHTPSTNVNIELKAEVNRNRANSADTRRHCLPLDNQWLSPAKSRQELDHFVQEATEVRFFKPAPVLQRFQHSLAPPWVDERPSSRAGVQSSARDHSPFDKDLPALPRYLAPAPLFACGTDILAATTPVLLGAGQLERSFIAPENLVVEEPLPQTEEGRFAEDFAKKPHSHFSTWSSDFVSESYLTSDDEAATSPTFSSLASEFSDAGSPRRHSMRFSFAEPAYSNEYSSQSTDGGCAEVTDYSCLSATPPQLDCLRLSSFGSDLFSLDIQHADAMSRRQATCFGFGFQGYSLPEDETASKTTITTESTLRPQHAINVKRESSASQFAKLMDDFSYLGESVV